jgi:hypothetical protein
MLEANNNPFATMILAHLAGTGYAAQCCKLAGSEVRAGF